MEHDNDRISRILFKIKSIWSNHPNMSFLQLLSNIQQKYCQLYPGEDGTYADDKIIEEVLDSYF